MESENIRLAIESARSIVWLPADFALCRIKLADIALQHKMINLAEEYMGKARKFIERERTRHTIQK